MTIGICLPKNNHYMRPPGSDGRRNMARRLSLTGKRPSFPLEGQHERSLRGIGRLGPLPQQVLAELKKISVKTLSQRSVLLVHVARLVEGP